MIMKTIELTRVDLLKTIAERKLQQDEIKNWLGLSINYMLDTALWHRDINPPARFRTS